MNCWDIGTYPDEEGFKRRIAGVIEAWAQKPFGNLSLATSYCPDTGKPVRTWALEGEEITSPYTGKKFRQGPTGYFGPKERDAQGHITRFGGDPLKYELQPATARLMLHPEDTDARRFVAIPGNLNQQYHFAAINWARFLGLVGDRMDPEWQAAFRRAVANYRESRRASDGERESLNPPHPPFDLVGEEDLLLGGNPLNGGTENHKTMWRTSGLLYAQLLGPDGFISGRPAPKAAEQTAHVLGDFLRRLFLTGNGEYDSPIYYVHSMVGFLNLYDFSPVERTRELAKCMLDYYLATYGLKFFDGVMVGASKRGFSNSLQVSGTDQLVRTFCPAPEHDCAAELKDPFRRTGCEPPVPVPAPPGGITLHQATTRYRPNRVIHHIVTKAVALPYEARIARPSYHMDQSNRTQETFFCDRDFAIGSAALTLLDNPVQQTVWSLAARTAAGPAVIGGGHPLYRSPQGHSPHDQVFQHRSTLILITAHHPGHGAPLQLLPRDLPLDERWTLAPNAAESWLFVPRRGTSLLVENGLVLIEAGSAHIAAHPLGMAPFRLGSRTDSDEISKVVDPYEIIVFPGLPTGFVIEIRPACECGSLQAFGAAVRARTRIDRGDWTASGRIAYTNLAGQVMEATYDPASLRCRAALNGHPVDWNSWCNGGVYESPYVTIGHGRMKVTDGHEGYETQVTPGGITVARL